MENSVKLDRPRSIFFLFTRCSHRSAETAVKRHSVFIVDSKPEKCERCVTIIFSSTPPERRPGMSGISHLSWFHFTISLSLVLLPTRVALSVLSFFSAYWPILPFFPQKILQHFSLRDRLFGMKKKEKKREVLYPHCNTGLRKWSHLQTLCIMTDSDEVTKCSCSNFYLKISA